MQTNQPNIPSQYDDEIDLFELFQTLWEQKWLILATSLITPILAYVFTALVPVKKDYYEGRVLIEIATVTTVSTEKSERGFQTIESPNDLTMLLDKVVGVKANVPRNSQKLIELTVTSAMPDDVEAQLTKGVNWVLGRHQNLINNLSSIQVINPSNQVAEPSIILKSPKDKLKLILAVAFVLGGMLGVFMALIRNAIQKHRQQNELSS